MCGETLEMEGSEHVEFADVWKPTSGSENRW